MTKSCQFWTSARLNRLYFSILLALAIAAICISSMDKDQSSAINRGDFPAFYAAATIAKDQSANLYDQTLQMEIQNHYWPSLNGSYYFFAYPPYVAQLLQPLSALTHIQAKYVYTSGMLLALLLGAYITSKLVSDNSKSLLAITTSFFCFGPVLSGLAAGQNIALSMLCYCGALELFSHNTKRGDFICGLLLGAWAFKPNFALIALFFVLLTGRKIVLIGAAFPLFLFYLLALKISGPEWPFIWVNTIQFFTKADFIANQHQMVSVIGVFHALATSLNATADTENLLNIMAIALTTIIGILTAIPFIKTFRISDSKTKLQSDAMYLLGPAIVLISPHTLYYDLGLCLIPCATFMRFENDKNINILILLLILIFAISLSKGSFAVSPLFFFALFSFMWLYRQLLLKSPRQGAS